MPGIRTQIELYDAISAPMMNIINAVNMSISAMGNLQATMNEPVSNAIAEGIDAQMNQAMQAIEEARAALTEPVSHDNTGIVWNTPNMDVFTNTGVERFQQEIQSTNAMMERLSTTQAEIASRASRTGVFPPNMVSDMDNMQNRIYGIQERISAIESNPLNLGTDLVNNELEQLRIQLTQAIEHQEDMNQAIQRMDINEANQAYLRLSQTVDNTERYIRDNVDEQGRFNRAIDEGAASADGLAGGIKKAVGAFLGIAAVKKSVNWVQDTLDLSDVQMNVERQLQTVLANVGASEDAFYSLKKTAASMQDDIKLYSGTALLGGAGELATYISDVEAIESMMGTLTNYAAGMSGGGEVDVRQMVEYATQLGKALDGTYDGLRMKGFELSEAQKEIIENGTDMEKALVLDDVISQSWAGLAEQMANTPQGQLIQMKNNFADIQEQIGTGLYPTVMMFFNTINSNMPEIQSMMMVFATIIQYVIFAINGVIEAASMMYSFIADNWSIISPIIYGIVAALMAYYGAVLMINTIQGIKNALDLVSATITAAKAGMSRLAATAYIAEATGASQATAAQWALNSAMLASPITWIVLGIIAIITAIYLAVAAFNKFAGTSVSATGIIFGAFTVLGAFLWNLFLGLLDLVLGVINALINPFIRIANFIGNVFTSPVSSIIYLFQSMADGVLGVLQKIASAMDFIFGSNMADTVAGWRSGLKDLADEAVKEYAPDENYQNIIDELDLSAESLGLERWAYGDAWDVGYSAGEGVEDAIKNIDPASLFGGNVPNPDDFAFAYDASSVPANIADTAENTGKIKDSVDISQEDLKYMRDLAEQEVVNRFTTAEIKVDMPVSATVSNEMDLDGVIDYLGEGINVAMEKIATEGVHT